MRAHAPLTLEVAHARLQEHLRDIVRAWSDEAPTASLTDWELIKRWAPQMLDEVHGLAPGSDYDLWKAMEEQGFGPGARSALFAGLLGLFTGPLGLLRMEFRLPSGAVAPRSLVVALMGAGEEPIEHEGRPVSTRDIGVHLVRVVGA